MKRVGQLLAAIADPGNLRLAFWKAAKGKRAKADCRAFQENLDANLSALRAELLAGRANLGAYHYFEIPKPRAQRGSPRELSRRVHRGAERPWH